MKVWIPFITLLISVILFFKNFLSLGDDVEGLFWFGCALLSLGILWRNLFIDEWGNKHDNGVSPIGNIIYWIITISLLLTGITEYLFGEDSLAFKIAFSPLVLMIGVPLIFLLIGGLLGGLSNSNSTKNTTYSVKGTFDGKNFEAKAKKDK